MAATRPGGAEGVLQIAFLLGFCGFGVKAALFPFHHWLPTASVAPTPVTALLHAVAVVKAGIFAVARLIYFGYGAGALLGTRAQTAALMLATVTIVFGSSMALREKHLKRRLAYSTISNLSYILFSLALMTPDGLTGGLTHLLSHAVIKILLFFCAGAILYQNGREYINQLRGIGRRMPVTMGCFALAALSLIGIPPMAGFVSKWQLLSAGLDAPLQGFGIAGLAVLILSALLTAGYLLPVVTDGFFPGRDFITERREVGPRMTGPMLAFAAAVVVLGLAPGGLMEWLGRFAARLFP